MATALTWAVAASNCGALAAGGTLATLRSSAEAAAAISVLPATGSFGVWIGLNDVAASAAGADCVTSRTCVGWVWQRAGESTAFITSAAGQALWQTGEPNNYFGNEHCTHFSFPPSAKLNDNNCGNVGGSVCERAQTVCPAGAYCPAGSSAPIICPAGTFSSATGATSAAACNVCAAGFFGATAPAGSTASCSPCAAGQYTATAGQAACLPCAAVR